MKKNKSLAAKWKIWLGSLGPGLITGASDDDPSGITTYTQAGARFGPALLWTALFTYPLMVAVQEMCARIGLVNKHGLTGIIKRYYPRPVLYFVLLLSFPSVILNIGADIAGIGAVAELLVPAIPSWVFSIVITLLLLYALVKWNYRKIATILKWLCISLFAYIVIPFITDTDWKAAARNTFIPNIRFNEEYLLALVAILGTTISPYLFFWQTNMEVEEVQQQHIVVDKTMITAMEYDVKTGMLFTNIVFYFIILAAGSVLYSNGKFEVNTIEEAAQALRPLAGEKTYLLFAAGIIGTGLISIPVLAGSLSYMMAETFNWSEGLDKKFHEAKGFYITMGIALVLGLLIQFLGISPVKALIYTAILYGMIAPILIAVILHISNNQAIMGHYRNNRMSNFFGWAALLLMSGAAITLIVFILKKGAH